jgi:hypothetical protein
MDCDEFGKICDERHLADRERISKLENIIPKIFDMLDKYKLRPSWVVAGIITFLATALGVTITELLHRMGK